ncbi:hypothetical protein DesfrDRAFT_0933 [Solidesulfovibrio fructosivorans JJ]]|uniref:Tetratricopeptide repeat protein n=1 Tax=Solidesulfovibrio fructosivorans JJ] TaxID=596151 RepID=E1JTI4_SOLFR|nr:hypothetical protein [Solidesulfovibrio fructosivorans]EFL52444.1 hypothetical protein DesfrDRAFT_0933 [Solidesulfovibrio fructosivorans JJ]]
MRTLLSFTVALWLLASGAALAGGPGHTALEAARRDYAAGRYAAAAASFDAATKADPGLVGTALCLDAATASRLGGEPGRAAWWLYRARRLDPADGAVAAALAAAGLEVTAVDAPLAGLVAPRLLWTLVLTANALFWFGLAGLRFFRARAPRRCIVVAAALVAALWLAAGWTSVGPVLFPRAVALRAVEAASAPEPGAATLFSLAPGTVVVPGPSRNGFVRVVTEKGGAIRAGWVDRNTVAALPR